MDNDTIEICKLGALALTGGFTLYKYYRNSEGQDKLELDVKIYLVNKSNSYTLIDIKTSITNKGKVRAIIPMKNLYLELLQYESDDYTKGKVNLELNGRTKIPLILSEDNNNEDYTWINGDTTQHYHRYLQVGQKYFFAKAKVTLVYNDKRKDWQTATDLIKL